MPRVTMKIITRGGGALDWRANKLELSLLEAIVRLRPAGGRWPHD